MHEIDLERAQRREARWRILRALDAGRPLPVAETLLLDILTDIDLPITAQGVRRELTYLADLGLVALSGTERPTWSARLTARGIDVVEYEEEAPAGVNRPRRWT